MQIYTDLQMLGDAMWPFIFQAHLGDRISQIEAMALIQSIGAIKQTYMQELQEQQQIEKERYDGNPA